ncbi:MAG: hypothetical protein IPM21_03600 [Acidobacteria bacterium]|nr:hypothetical protein [Acidobacteriota bacterium]
MRPYTLYFFLVFVVIFSLAEGSKAQGKASSIVIHDTTSPANGGENATKGLRDKFRSALENAKPCVETMDDQDLRDALQDERERELLEGGDPSDVLKALGERLGAGMIMNVQALPGPGGTTVYSGSVIDTTSARAVARETGSESEVAEQLVRDLGPYLADTCKPHWTGTVNYVFSSSETKTTDDSGAAHAVRRNVKRRTTETSNMQHTIKASLSGAPAAGASVNSPKARVMQRTQFTFGKSSNSSGEVRCREPGKNPYFTNFSEEYTETTTQLGQGTDTMPVFISIDSDGSYSIKVNAPAGVIYGKYETRRNYSGCPSEKPPTQEEPQSLPEGKLQPTSFDAEGKVDAKNRDRLSGSHSSPDGKTKITWNLRLVKPKGK